MTKRRIAQGVIVWETAVHVIVQAQPIARKHGTWSWTTSRGDLDAFAAKHTSEDNDSFREILETHNAKRSSRYGWQQQATMDAKEAERVRAEYTRRREHDRARRAGETGVHP